MDVAIDPASPILVEFHLLHAQFRIFPNVCRKCDTCVTLLMDNLDPILRGFNAKSLVQSILIDTIQTFLYAPTSVGPEKGRTLYSPQPDINDPFFGATKNEAWIASRSINDRLRKQIRHTCHYR